jgi:putative oxidoreductase
MTSQSIAYEGSVPRPSSNILRRVLTTTDAPALTALRMTLAIVMFPHGAQKLLGWFGGYGFSGTMGFLTSGVGLPGPLAFAVILIEFFAPLLLVLGFATRFVAAGIATIMLGAIATVHAPNGFFMNWSGQQAGEGFEFHLLVIGITLALILAGGGRWSADHALSERCK